MKANEYQYQASRTLINEPDFEITPQQTMIAWNAIGLSGEAGEVADCRFCLYYTLLFISI